MQRCIVFWQGTSTTAFHIGRPIAEKAANGLVWLAYAAKQFNNRAWKHLDVVSFASVFNNNIVILSLVGKSRLNAHCLGHHHVNMTSPASNNHKKERNKKDQAENLYVGKLLTWHLIFDCSVNCCSDKRKRIDNMRRISSKCIYRRKR